MHHRQGDIRQAQGIEVALLNCFQITQDYAPCIIGDFSAKLCRAAERSALTDFTIKSCSGIPVVRDFPHNKQESSKL